MLLIVLISYVANNIVQNLYELIFRWFFWTLTPKMVG